MKARIATLLSLTGVLVAGSAAALVNGQVLRASDNVWASDPLITLVVEAPNAPTTSAPPVISPAVAEPAPVRSAYQIGDAALVTLDTSGGVLTVESAVPGAGWAVVASRSVDATNIEVQLQSESSLVAFRANLLLGVVSTSVEVVEPAAPGGNPVVVVTTQPAAPGATVAPITTPSVSVAAVPSTTDAAAAGPATTIDEPDDSDDPDHDDPDHDGEGDDGADDEGEEDD